MKWTRRWHKLRNGKQRRAVLVAGRLKSSRSVCKWEGPQFSYNSLNNMLHGDKKTSNHSTVHDILQERCNKEQHRDVDACLVHAPVNENPMRRAHSPKHATKLSTRHVHAVKSTVVD